MPDIIFSYTQETNWLDKNWAKAKKIEIQRRQLEDIEFFFPNLTNRQKAEKAGVGYVWYMQLRKRYGLDNVYIP